MVCTRQPSDQTYLAGKHDGFKEEKEAKENGHGNIRRDREEHGRSLTAPVERCRWRRIVAELAMVLLTIN